MVASIWGGNPRPCIYLLPTIGEPLVDFFGSKPTNNDGGCAIRERFLSDSAPYSQSRERKAKMKIKTAKQFRNGVDSAFETPRAGPRSAAFGGPRGLRGLT